MELEFAISTFASIFAIINPMGAVPNYAALTQGFGKAEKKMIIKRAFVVALIVLMTFAIVGRFVFDFLNITVDAFRVAGGLVLLLIALDMVQGKTPQSRLNQKEKLELTDIEQIGVVPLGVPLLAGPGAITTVMIASTDGTGQRGLDTLIVILCIMIVLLIAFLILRQSDLIFARLGRTGTKVFSRVMGLLLGAMAVQFMADGLIGLVEPVLSTL